MAERITVGEVRQGHSIPGLDNGYVVEVQGQDGYLSQPTGRYNTALPEDTICLTLHDADGNEFYLLASSDMPITVDAIEPRWVGM